MKLVTVCLLMLSVAQGVGIALTYNFHSFLAYFPKMKVGLSNHQYVFLSVCLSVSLSMCPPLITSEGLGRFS
jgi:hypothetical protein